MPRRLIELRVYPDTWVLSPSFSERLVFLSYPFNEGMQAVLVAQSRAFYPVITSNVRAFNLKSETDAFRMPVNIWPEEALAFKAIPRDYKQNSGYCRVLIEVEDDLQTDPTAIIEELQQQVADQATAIAALQQANTSQDSEIATLQADLATVEGGGSDQAAAIATLQSSVNSLANINASQDGAIASLQSSVGAISSANASQDSAIAAILTKNTSQDSAIAAMQAQIAALTANLNWQNLSLINGWVPYGGVLGPGQYAKANGWVFLRGVLNGMNNSSDTFAILPTGHRPAVRLILDAVAGGAGLATTAARLDVTTAGELISINSRPPFLSLDGLAFYSGN